MTHGFIEPFPLLLQVIPPSPSPWCSAAHPGALLPVTALLHAARLCRCKTAPVRPEQPKAAVSCSKVYTTSKKRTRQPVLLFPSFLGGLCWDSSFWDVAARKSTQEASPAVCSVPANVPQHPQLLAHSKLQK